jgi:hypothetical protein
MLKNRLTTPWLESESDSRTSLLSRFMGDMQMKAVRSGTVRRNIGIVELLHICTHTVTVGQNFCSTIDNSTY